MDSESAHIEVQSAVCMVGSLRLHLAVRPDGQRNGLRPSLSCYTGVCFFINLTRKLVTSVKRGPRTLVLTPSYIGPHFTDIYI